MNSLDSTSLTFWESVGLWGFIFVWVGVAGEGVDIFIKLFCKKLHERKKHSLDVIGAVFWVVLVIALAIEFLGNVQAMRIADLINSRLNDEAGQARKAAGEANERASTNEAQVATLEKETADAKLETAKIELDKAELGRKVGVLFDENTPRFLLINPEKLHEELRKRPKGTFEILYLATDQEASFFAKLLASDLQRDGWKMLRYKSITLKEAEKLDSFGGIVLKGKDGDSVRYDNKQLQFMFPTNSALGNMYASLLNSRDGTIMIQFFGDSSLKDGSVQIVIGQKIM